MDEAATCFFSTFILPTKKFYCVWRYCRLISMLNLIPFWIPTELLPLLSVFLDHLVFRFSCISAVPFPYVNLVAK